MSTAVCCRCGRPTEAPVTVGYIPSASGPGFSLYACPDCALKIDPGPSPEDAQSVTDPR